MKIKIHYISREKEFILQFLLIKKKLNEIDLFKMVREVEFPVEREEQ